MFWENGRGHQTILVVPNYTFSEDIEKDSFVDVLYSQIKALEGASWILPVPKGKGISKLNLFNVRQVEINMSGNMIWMRSNLPLDMIKLLKNEQYNVIYSHLPDWHISRFTNMPIVGYAHWFEMEGVNGLSWLNRSLNFGHEMINLLDYKVCFLNTHQQKEMVLANARKIFNDDVVGKLDKILQVMHLGVDKKWIVNDPTYPYEKIIVFNHRTETYKGWPRFYDWMKKYREHRQDFKVWAPLLYKPVSESWIDKTKYPKEQYYEMLTKCAVGVQPKQLHGGWSVSATDCMMRGCPMLFEEQDCFREIDDRAIMFKSYKQLERCLDYYLDDYRHRAEFSEWGIEAAHKLTNNSLYNIKQLKKYLEIT
jgi:hypothetical protein